MTVVYWLYDGKCLDPATDGYVGISDILENRVLRHRRSKRFPEFEVKVLYESDRRSCFDEEKRLRPREKMGWNLAPGGVTTEGQVWASRLGGMAGKGRIKTEEECKRISQAKKGVPVLKLQVPRPGFSEARRQSPKWQTHIQRLNESQRGVPRTAETKQKLSLIKKGKRPPILDVRKPCQICGKMIAVNFGNLAKHESRHAKSV